MKHFRKLAALFVGLMCLFAASPGDAAGLPVKGAVVAPTIAPPVNPWSFDFTPYLWAAGLSGGVQLGPAAPVTNVDASFSDIINHLRFAAMGTIEARKGRFGLVADLIYLSPGASGTGPAGFLNAQLKDKTFVGTFNVAYRVIDRGSWWVDVEGGARVWAMNIDLNFNVAPLGRSRAYSIDKSWVDPIIGVRARANLGSKFFVQGYADVGGFGVSAKSDWQVAGFLGYQYSPSISFAAGYRYMAVDYNRDGFVWDVHMSGPMIAATFKFN